MDPLHKKYIQISSLNTKNRSITASVFIIIELQNAYFAPALSSASLAFISLTLSMFFVTT